MPPGVSNPNGETGQKGKREGGSGERNQTAPLKKGKANEENNLVLVQRETTRCPLGFPIRTAKIGTGIGWGRAKGLLVAAWDEHRTLAETPQQWAPRPLGLPIRTARREKGNVGRGKGMEKRDR